MSEDSLRRDEKLCGCDTGEIQNSVVQRKSCNGSLSSFNKKQTQKRIQNQVGVSSSQLSNTATAINILSFQNNFNQRDLTGKKAVAVKHGSYERRLGKIKGKHIVSSAKDSSNSFSLVNIKNCKSCI
uniref:Uncharacterized protein n=1 Tax=viral metagenome TaxID=1070528 RepID=A0A6C0AZJ1_9ZZZZ|tara:strand:- start:518 stop:898 length:381 start_codon:yes stop_codon:yes gene_type:complete